MYIKGREKKIPQKKKKEKGCGGSIHLHIKVLHVMYVLYVYVQYILPVVFFSFTHICMEKDEASRDRWGGVKPKKKTGLAPPKKIMDFDLAGLLLLVTIQLHCFSDQYIYFFIFFDEEKFNICFNIANNK